MLRRNCICKNTTSSKIQNPTVQRVLGILQKHHEQHKKLESDIQSHLQVLHEDIVGFVKEEVNSFHVMEQHARTKFVVATVPTIAKEEKGDLMEEVYVEQEEDYHNSDELVREDFVSE